MLRDFEIIVLAAKLGGRRYANIKELLCLC